jgi:hypothetical protein
LQAACQAPGIYLTRRAVERMGLIRHLDRVATFEIRMRRYQRIELVAYPTLLIRRQRRDETDRHETIHDHFPHRADMSITETGLDKVGEESSVERLAPVASVITRSIPLVRRDEFHGGGNPIDALVSHIPDEA